MTVAREAGDRINILARRAIRKIGRTRDDSVRRGIPPPRLTDASCLRLRSPPDNGIWMMRAGDITVLKRDSAARGNALEVGVSSGRDTQ